MMKYAVKLGSPVAIRYPRGEAYDGLKEHREVISTGRSELLYRGSKVAIMALGSMVPVACQVREMLKEYEIEATVINARFAMPFDKQAIKALCKGHTLLVTMEENVSSGGFGEHVSAYVEEEELEISVLSIAIPDGYVEHGNVNVLKEKLGLDADSSALRILKVLQKK